MNTEFICVRVGVRAYRVPCCKDHTHASDKREGMRPPLASLAKKTRSRSVVSKPRRERRDHVPSVSFTPLFPPTSIEICLRCAMVNGASFAIATDNAFSGSVTRLHEAQNAASRNRPSRGYAHRALPGRKGWDGGVEGCAEETTAKGEIVRMTSRSLRAGCPVVARR